MSEPYCIAMSLTPLNKPCQEVIALVYQYLKVQQKRKLEIPTGGLLQLVDPNLNRIVGNPHISYDDFYRMADNPPSGMTYWYGMEETVFFNNWYGAITISIRKLSKKLTHMELWLPSKLHEYVYDFDFGNQFNQEIKSALLSFFVGITKAVEADGFGVRLANDDSIFGALQIEVLRDFIEIGNRWYEQSLDLCLAGLATQIVDEKKFEYDFDENPMHYRCSGYYIYDMMY